MIVPKKYILRFLALGYLLAVLLGPLSMVFWRSKLLSRPYRGPWVYPT